MKKEGDTRLATPDARRGLVIQGFYKKAVNNNDEDSISETTLLKISARQNIFSDLPEEEIVKIFKNKFKPINLYKLWHFHDFENTQEKDSIVIENNLLRPWKTMHTYKNLGKNINKV